EVTAERILGSRGPLKLDVNASSTSLKEEDTWDMAAVRIRITDSCGNTCPYVQLPIRFELKGEAELIGPDVVTAEGGMCGTYIRTTGKPGKAELKIKCNGLEDVVLTFDISVNQL
ncbi:MAG: glycoside hydrolase family 2 protein, partial [Firmicutes bacterium]|nr:glycoside hydrolase family 2 protein [Bacillota bacterium]